MARTWPSWIRVVLSLIVVLALVVGCSGELAPAQAEVATTRAGRCVSAI